MPVALRGIVSLLNKKVHNLYEQPTPSSYGYLNAIKATDGRLLLFLSSKKKPARRSAKNSASIFIREEILL